MKLTRKKAAILLIKLAVAGALLAFALRDARWRNYTKEITDPSGQVQIEARDGLRTILSEVDCLPLIGAVACFAAGIFIVAVRWWFLLRVLRIRIHWYEAVRLTFLGYFFSFLVPGVVSGDLFKAYYVFKHTDRKAAAMVSIFVDRVTGLLMFSLMAAGVLGGLIVAGAWQEKLNWPAMAVGIVLGMLALGSTVMLVPTTRRLFGRLLSFGPLKHHLDVAGKAVELYRRRFAALLGAAGFTFCSQAIHITGILLLGQGLHLTAPWYEYYLYAPLIYIVAAVPISPGGLGVMEAAFRWLFVDISATLTVTQVAALALLVRLGSMACSLPGLIVSLTGAKLPKTEQMEAELDD